VSGHAPPPELQTDYVLADGRRPVAGAVLLHPDGRTLLQHRDDKPEIESPGLWSLFGGGLDEGESPAQAMLREIEEEVGYRPRAYRPLVTFSGWGTLFHVYLAEVAAPLEQLTLAEGQGFGYFTQDEADGLALTEVARVSLLALRMLQQQRDDGGGGQLLPGYGV
jgi:8-oxo-dGTP diphosphatase